MGSASYVIEFPPSTSQTAPDQEWVIVRFEDHEEKLRLHDYKNIFRIPGLYEEIVCKHLKYTSPEVICRLLKQGLQMAGEESKRLRVLDLGAGNGLSGESLRKGLDVDVLVGLDSLPEARDATERDRPGTYDDYFVLDLSKTRDFIQEGLKPWDFNVLMTVGALGFKDIPVPAFVSAFKLLMEDGWIAFNINEAFLSPSDTSGFRETIDSMVEENLVDLQTERYCHRLSTSGNPIHYRAFVGRKKTIPRNFGKSPNTSSDPSP
jgi:hypothetical protein